MRLLLILMTLMSVTVETNNSVSMDGLWPYDIEVSYANTGKKGSVTAGQVATLSLSHLEGITVDQVIVYVKSNKSAGAGTFTLSLNGQTTATKSGTFKDWTGSWDNTNYHPIVLQSQSVNGVHSLEIQLEGTANSLHINRYDISWSPRPAHTLTLMRGNSIYTTLTESSGMDGIVLPTLPDSAEWRFRGWSEHELWTVHETPVLLAPNTTYYPEEDETLWAVWEYEEEENDSPYVSAIENGEYRYINSESNMVLAGLPVDGRMTSAPLLLTDDDQVYTIELVDTATVTITHTRSGTPIGFTGTRMSTAASVWNVYHSGEEFLFYTQNGAKTYILWLNVLDGWDTYAGLIETGLQTSPMRLMPVREKAEQIFTSHPELPMGITNERVNEDTEERSLMRFGTFELILKNGKKELRTTK